MAFVAGIAVALIALLMTHSLIEYRRDRRWRKALRDSRLHENWRQVPPPNWASRRGTQDYW